MPEVIAGEGVVMASCVGDGEIVDGATTVVAVNATDGSILWKFRPDNVLYLGSGMDCSF